MSHFVVGVILPEGEGISEVMAPFCEEKQVPLYIDMTREELVTEWRTCLEEAKDPEKYLGKLQLGTTKKDFLTGVEKSVEPVDILGMDVKTFAKWYHGDDKFFDTEGNMLTSYNPQSKWDWYEIGGRWRGMLLVKEECSGYSSTQKDTPEGYKWVDSARIKDIAFDVMVELAEKRAKETWDAAMVAGVLQGSGEAYFRFGIRKGDTEESYVARMIVFSPYAILTPDGEWHEAGSMGGFGCSNATKDEEGVWIKDCKPKLIDTADPELMLMMVDCHI